VLHLPAYSLLGDPLASAARRAAMLARDAGASVSVDLASAGPLLARGRQSAHRAIAAVAPDLLFTNAAEATAFLGDADIERLLEVAPVVLVKRGPRGATLVARTTGAHLIRLEVATRPRAAADTTGAGDAFDAGFLAQWLARGRETSPADLRRAVVAGNRAAARQIAAPRPELALG
jgi:sugar/nucleoside kinase (ribokinase family)